MAWLRDIDPNYRWNGTNWERVPEPVLNNDDLHRAMWPGVAAWFGREYKNFMTDDAEYGTPEYWKRVWGKVAPEPEVEPDPRSEALGRANSRVLRNQRTTR